MRHVPRLAAFVMCALGVSAVPELELMTMPLSPIPTSQLSVHVALDWLAGNRVLTVRCQETCQRCPGWTSTDDEKSSLDGILLHCCGCFLPRGYKKDGMLNLEGQVGSYLLYISLAVPRVIFGQPPSSPLLPPRDLTDSSRFLQVNCYKVGLLWSCLYLVFAWY